VTYIPLLNTCGRGPPYYIPAGGAHPYSTPKPRGPNGFPNYFYSKEGGEGKTKIGVPDIPFSLGFTQS